eukprot:NODE_115_length_19014_cov_0.489664.p12 type:complete len:101 gc:universal NODE_115_length_19014_cov_0.489664:1824-2126(+)
MGLPFKVARKIVDRKLSFNIKNIKQLKIPQDSSIPKIKDFKIDILPAIKYQAAHGNHSITTSYGENLIVENIHGKSITLNPANISLELENFLGKAIISEE